MTEQSSWLDLTAAFRFGLDRDPRQSVVIRSEMDAIVRRLIHEQAAMNAAASHYNQQVAKLAAEWLARYQELDYRWQYEHQPTETFPRVTLPLERHGAGAGAGATTERKERDSR